MSSRTFTSCLFPSETSIKVGMGPRRSSSVCSFTAAFSSRKCPMERLQDKDRWWWNPAHILWRSGQCPVVRSHTSGARWRSALSKIGVNTPVARLVRVGQSRAGDVAAEPQMIELARHRLKAEFNVAELSRKVNCAKLMHKN